MVVPRLRRLRRPRGAETGAGRTRLQPKDVAFVSGIGCSGKISGYLHSYAFHGVHGRALPVATAVKLANRDLTVIAAGGDGDGYAIGAGHFIHAVRRNPDITYIVMDNQTYGLTKGQSSPTSSTGLRHRHEPGRPPRGADQRSRRSRSPPAARSSRAASPRSRSISSSCLKAAIQHRGFSVVEVMSPCVTYNKINTYAWFKENVTDVAAVPGFDPTDRVRAFEMLNRHDKIPLGVLYTEERATLEELTHIPERPVTQTPITGLRERYLELQEAYR